MNIREQLEKDLKTMFKNMDDFEYDVYGQELWCMLRNQTPDLFVDDLICSFNYDYDDLMDIDLENIVQDTIEHAIIPELTGLDDEASEALFEKILDISGKKFNEEEEEEEEEEPKYESINLDLELYHENGQYGMWISDRIGGSGIDVKGSTKEECAQEAAKYLVDYLYKLQ